MSVLMKSDGLHRTLAHASPTFDTLFRVDRIGFIFFDLIDLTGTDLGAVSTTIAFVWVNNRIHNFKLQISNCF